MSIQEIVLKIKGWAGDYDPDTIHRQVQVLILAVLGLCLGLSGYFIGRIQSSVKHQIPPDPVVIRYPPQPTTTCEYVTKPVIEQSSETDSSESGGNYVASKTGKTYYPKNCKSVNRIKPENRVYFTTVREATAKGLTLSKACTSS